MIKIKIKKFGKPIYRGNIPKNKRKFVYELTDLSGTTRHKTKAELNKNIKLHEKLGVEYETKKLRLY